MSITLSSCFYVMKSKSNLDNYIGWINNLLSIVNNFNLVIYTDHNSVKYINTNNNQKIHIVIKPIEEFFNYQYKNYWIKNHQQNQLLNHSTCWELNMLWSEKIWFVNETIENKYFDTEFYGWCDIGYFRNRHNDLHTSQLNQWPNCDKILGLNKNNIYYARVNNNNGYLNKLFAIVNNKNEYGLPTSVIPPTQYSIAGGFFIIHKDKIQWWMTEYNNKLTLYFHHNYLVKDDQIILADCILSNLNHFTLVKENNPKYDNWFMFQRLLQ